MDESAIRNIQIDVGPVSEAFITDVWYVVGLAHEVRARQMVTTTVCGGPLTMSRDREGRLTAAHDGRTVTLREAHGLVWYCHGEPRSAQPIPPLKVPGKRVRYGTSVVIPADFDNAAYGLLDPAHTPFVHRSPLWRGNGILKEKTKRFEPNEFGWTMMPHAPVNSDIYKLIGGQIRVRIEFRLPGTRAEYIENDRHAVLGLTALTPIDDRHTRLRQVFFWSSPVMTALRPILPLIARPFLKQDVNIMALRRSNEPYGGRGMLLGDSDRQFVWYQSVKKTWEKTRDGRIPFVNPVGPATLRWRT